MAEIGTNIEEAQRLLRNGDIVAIPTETVYGLAGNAFNEDAILKIFQAKNRPKFDPLIAHTDSVDKIKDFVSELPNKVFDLSQAFWPGPLTILLEKKPMVPDLLTSGLNRVAVRVPKHPLTNQLLASLDFPLAAPSANPFGYVSPTTAQHVENQMGDRVPYILDGGSCRIGLESTIVGFEGNEVVVYRLGGTQIEDLEKVVGKVKIQVNESSNPAAPGMLKSHYSPGRKMIIGDIKKNLERYDNQVTGIVSFSTKYDVPEGNQAVLSSKSDLTEAARNIFSALRKMDQPQIEVILTEYMPDEGLGRAINDRLKRAAV